MPAFNHNPDWTDELRGPAEMIPAIPLLKEYFGGSVGPLLYAEAIKTQHQWLRSRVALAARTIMSIDEIETANSAFSVDVDSANLSARGFAVLLRAERLDVELASPSQEVIDKVMRALERKLEKEP